MAITKKTIEQLPPNESSLTGETLFEISINGISYRDWETVVDIVTGKQEGYRDWETGRVS